MIRIKRAYDPVSPDDGERVLVDRLWPRGVSKERIQIAPWAQDVAPSRALFAMFPKSGQISESDTLLYNSPGENSLTTNPTRVFPDLQQILDNNTNAETGACPSGPIDSWPAAPSSLAASWRPTRWTTADPGCGSTATMASRWARYRSPRPGRWRTSTGSQMTRRST